MNVAIAGKMGSGKSTVANFVFGMYGLTREALASPLKQICSVHSDEHKWPQVYDAVHWLLPDAPEADIAMLCAQIYEVFRVTPPSSTKPRVLLQRIGTDILRAYDPEIWVRALFRRMKPGRIYVIDDVRFQNEVDVLRSAGWFMVLCRVAESIRLQRIADQLDGVGHCSEADLDSLSLATWDYIVDTGGARSSLPSLVAAMMYARKMKSRTEQDYQLTL